MEKNYFTEEQIWELKKNRYVRSVTQKTIVFTTEFKEHFIKESEVGKGPTRIFIESGFNPYILGGERIKNFSKRIKKKVRNNESLDDHRGKKSTGRRKKVKNVYASKDEEIEALKHKNLVLEQENEFLKKIISLTQTGH